nr:glycosyltransferase [Sphingomonas jejuensis]
MARLLNAGVVGAVGNHGRRASAQLAEIGVDRRKIIPWDWAPARTPHEQEPKCSASNDGAVTLLFAGALARSKGVDDLVEAAGVLRQRGRKVRVDLLGGGDIERLRALAEEKGVADAVTLHGKVANRDVVPMMRAADMVIVPSHHDYPEGLPLTIYEALVSRTPIVASDHPMFSGNIVDGVSALIFPAGNAGALADRVEQLLDNPALYERLSRNGAAAWERLQLPVTFEDLVARWLEDDRDWLRAHSLAERNYAAAALSAAESA